MLIDGDDDATFVMKMPQEALEGDGMALLMVMTLISMPRKSERFWSLSSCSSVARDCLITIHVVSSCRP